MKLALHFPNFSYPGEPETLSRIIAETAKTADAGGFETMTFMDHWFQMEMRAPATEPMLEGYTTLGFVAGQTEHLKLGLLVTGVTYRYPGLLAKIIATLDVLSQGRAFLGIGAAWYEKEHLALGVPYPPISQRFEMLEEAIQICEQMWSDDDGPYVGRHYSLAETICRPRPLQNPRPPILIGGGGEKKTLKLVAKYADACNLFDIGDGLAEKLAVLDRHCEEQGRDPKAVQRTAISAGNPFDDVDSFLRKMEAWKALGIEQVWVSPPDLDPVKFAGRMAEEIVPRLAHV